MEALPHEGRGDITTNHTTQGPQVQHASWHSKQWSYMITFTVFPRTFNYRPQRSCEGYVFTRVCHSVHGGGGIPACIAVVSQHALQQEGVVSQHALQQGGACSEGCLLPGGVCSGGCLLPGGLLLGVWGSAPGGLVVCSWGWGCGTPRPRKQTATVADGTIFGNQMNLIFFKLLPPANEQAKLREGNVFTGIYVPFYSGVGR